MLILLVIVIRTQIPINYLFVINNLQLVINCCSVVNKHVELQALITSEEADLILGIESHLDT